MSLTQSVALPIMSLFSRLSQWWYGGSYWVPPLTKVIVEMPEVKPPLQPPLSCFAQGLINSIKDHPDEWFYVPGYGHGETFTHKTTSVRVGIEPSPYYGRGGLVYVQPYLDISDGLSYDLLAHERAAIINAVNTYLAKPQRASEAAARLQWEVDAKVKTDALKARFEKIGCPEGSQS